jgi:hypothetical protein
LTQYVVEWADAHGIPDRLLTCICRDADEARDLAQYPPAHWYYWSKRPTILPIIPAARAGMRRPPPDMPAPSLQDVEEAIRREYGVRITPQRNGRYTVARCDGACPTRVNLTIYEVGTAIRALRAALPGTAGAPARHIG